MSARLFAATTLVLVIAGSSHAYATEAADADPCTTISLDEEPLSPRDRFFRFVNRWWKWSEEAQTGHQQPSGELYFTVQSDYFYMPLCTDRFGEHPEMRRWMPYPVGLVVRPLATATISGTDYQLVETEYGLRTYLPSGRTKLIEPDKVYLFPNSNTPLDFCAREPECYEEEKQYLWINEHRYAVAYDAFIDADDGQCAIYEAELFDRATFLDQIIYIDPCYPYGEVGARKGNLKRVTLSEYERLFDVDFSGIYLRLTPKFMEHILPGSTHTRACNEFDIRNLTRKIEGGIKISVPLHIVTLDAGGRLEGMLMRTREEGKGLFSFYSPYAFYSSDSGSDIYVIEAISSCDSPNALPDNPYALIIVHPGSQVGKLTITVDAILEKYDNMARMQLYEPTRAHYLGQGQFWTVRDVHQYIDLIEILREVANHGGLREEIVRDMRNIYEIIRVIDFFAHLILAATTYFNPDPTFEEEPPWIATNLYPGFGVPSTSEQPTEGLSVF